MILSRLISGYEYFPVFPNEINIQGYNWKFRIWRSGLGSHVYETDCSFILLQWYTDRLVKARNFFHGKAGPRQEHDTMTGSVECCGKNTKLREQVNLDIVADYIDVKKSKDREQIQEIERMHALMKKYKLDGQFHWITAQTNRARNGELYRYIADTKGAFVQV
jgi:hypothetical protein